MFEAEQAILDRHREKYPTLKPYRLARMSNNHPTAHVVQQGEDYAACGTKMYRGFEAPAEGASSLCDRCRQYIQQRLA